MRCPFCKTEDTSVIDSRMSDEGDSVRRRRECSVCETRFTTYEVVEERPVQVLKRSGAAEDFDRRYVVVAPDWAEPYCQEHGIPYLPWNFERLNDRSLEIAQTLDEITKDFRRLQAQKAKPVGGVEAGLVELGLVLPGRVAQRVLVHRHGVGVLRGRRRHRLGSNLTDSHGAHCDLR